MRSVQPEAGLYKALIEYACAKADVLEVLSAAAARLAGEENWTKELLERRARAA